MCFQVILKYLKAEMLKTVMTVSSDLKEKKNRAPSIRIKAL